METKPAYSPPERLNDEELAFHADRLLGEFRQALLEIPEFCQRSGKRILGLRDEEYSSFGDERTELPFQKGGVSYTMTYRPHEFQAGLGRDQRADALYVSRKPFGTHGAVHVAIKTGLPKFRGGEHWDMLQWRSRDDPGAREEHTNTPRAIEMIEALLEELK